MVNFLLGYSILGLFGCLRKLSPVIKTRLAGWASLVQLVERWSPKPNVGGSSPPGRAIFFSLSSHSHG